MTGLFDPAEHRPLAGAPWSETAARAAIAEIASDAVGAFGGPERLWPNHPADLDGGDEDRPYRSAYLGAAGVAWALHRLAGEDLGPPLPGLVGLVAALPADYRAAPELTELETGTPPPPPGLMFGESGILLALEAIAPDETRRARLAACVTANARNPTRELCWGSPGTMLAALALSRATGEARWHEAYVDGADWLRAQWQEDLWVQELYGSVTRYVGAGHGFAGNAFALLAGADLRSDGAAELCERIAHTTAALAQRDGELAQWPALAERDVPRQPVQWCHGSPGIVTSLAGLPAHPVTDRLLAAGGELTWRAGPLRKGSGLCHGTAGNGFALLTLFARTGEARWLDRARAFGMDAAADVVAWRDRHGCGRYTLFTGDLGVALFLRACLDGGPPGFPFLTDALS